MTTKKFEPIKEKCGEIVDYILASHDMPSDDSQLFKLRLSVEEAVQNVVDYAYKNGDGFLEVSTEKDNDNVLQIQLKDAGKRFNPVEKEDPDVTLSADEREIGGLGIFLCKKLMDNVSYKYEDGCNNLTLEMNLNKK